MTIHVPVRRLVRAAALAVCLSLSGEARPAEAADLSLVFDRPAADARSWLKSNGFSMKIDADNTAKSRLRITQKGLVIETLARAEPLVARPNLSVAQPAGLTVTWGVDLYPVGANWDQGVNNEAVMVIIQFGNDVSSGGLFVPPSPPFIGFFLCERGRQNVPIKGRSYTRQGRYVCVGSPPVGQEITSVINLDAVYRAAFGVTSVPPVTGIAIEADTTQVSSDGRSSAWIKSITVKSK